MDYINILILQLLQMITTQLHGISHYVITIIIVITTEGVDDD